jgi:hypothetical protein
LSDKDFKVKNKLVVNGLTGGAGPLVANSSKEIDSVAFLTTLQGGTGTTTSPAAGQVLYSAGGTSYNPTALNTLDVKGASYSADAPSSPVIGQIWVESDTTSDSFDPNIIRRKSFTATAAQTTFTTDVPFIQGYEQVFFNGMLLVRNNDYTTTNDTTVVLTTGAAVNDVVEVVTITNLNSINAATTTTNTFTGNQVINNTSGTLLSIIADNGTASEPFNIFRSNEAAGIVVKRNNGSYLNPTAILAGERTAFYIGASTDGTSYANHAAINMWAAENQTSTARGSFITFDTTNLLSAGRSEKMRIDASGNVGIGTSSPGAKLHILGGSTGTIIETLRLDNSGNAANNGNKITWYNANTGIESSSVSSFREGSSLGYALTFSTTSNFSTTAATERMRITPEGNMSFRTVNSTSTVRKIARTDDNLTTDLASISMYGAGANNFNGVITFNVKNGGFYDSALAEVMRISSDGRVGIAMTTPRAALEVGGSILTVWDNASIGTMFADGSGYFLGIQTQVSPRFTDIVAKYADNGAIRFISGASIERARFESTNGYMLLGYTSSNGAFRLQVNSQIFATSSSISTSDGRYKENVNTITSGLDIVDSLRPVSFTWKEHPVHNFVAGKTVGFIAQEVKESLSQYDWVDNIIKTNTSDAILDEEGNEVAPAEEFLGIAESNIIPLLVAAVKELKARVETLEAN